MMIEPSTGNMEALRCCDCGKLLGYIDGCVSIKCSRCGAINIYVTEREFKGANEEVRLLPLRR